MNWEYNLLPRLLTFVKMCCKLNYVAIELLAGPLIHLLKVPIVILRQKLRKPVKNW